MGLAVAAGKEAGAVAGSRPRTLLRLIAQQPPRLRKAMGLTVAAGKEAGTVAGSPPRTLLRLIAHRPLRLEPMVLTLRVLK